MAEITRYDPMDKVAGMWNTLDGDYVLHSDHLAALRAERERCARAVCAYCAIGIPLMSPERNLPNTHANCMPCYAAAIWALPEVG